MSRSQWQEMTEGLKQHLLDSEQSDEYEAKVIGDGNIQGDGGGTVAFQVPSTIDEHYFVAERMKSKLLLEEVFPHPAEAELREGLQELMGKQTEVRSLLAKDHVAPFIEVRFKNVTWKVDVPYGDQSGQISTVASVWAKMCCFFRPRKIKEKVILNKISGILKPGTMTLILGPPGSGKSSLLKALAGRLPRHQVTGNIEYNGVSSHDLLLENLVGFVSQIDQHLAHLTVRETLEFALQCCTTANARVATLDEKLNKLRSLRTDFILKILGLDIVGDNIIGNELLRGISGGQRKRVTIGEILMRGNSVLFMDEISTGLDSATSFDIIRSLRISCKSSTQTLLMSLLQPAPEVVALFDDVLIMARGSIVYHGPVDKVLDYFNHLGFECPVHKDRADFLQEVTTPAGRQYFRPDAGDPPRNSEEFATRWKHSELYSQKAKELLEPFAPTANHGGDLAPYLLHAPSKREFARSYCSHQRLLVRRQVDLGKRDRLFLRIRLQQMVIVGLLVGSVFYQMALSQFPLRFSVVFFTLMFIALGNISNMAALMRIRGIFYKQRAANFFRTTNWVMAQQVYTLPTAFLEALLLSSVVYWMTGLEPEASNFFLFLFTLFISNIGMAAFARMLGCLLPDLDTAQPIAAFSVVLMVMFAGFLITEDKIPSYWIWAFWVSPLSWGTRTLCLNEFKSSTYDAVIGGKRLGDQYLEAYGMKTDNIYLWGGIIYLSGVFLFCLIFQVIGLHFLRYDQATGIVSSYEENEDDDDPLLEKKVEIKSERAKFPFTPMNLAFENISYTVTVPIEGTRRKEDRKLLSNISGFARAGRMLSLMGETGAGKTTLMDVLAARKTAGKMEGKILVNGFETPPHVYARVLGYVEQMDIHLSTATVREALQFSCNLRLPDVSEMDRFNFVNEIMHLLELEPLADAMIGSETSGLSTEQRKRVTIGVELAANPALLFLDEPTSGLDSRAADIIMRVIRNIAKTGRTIICTIHQPSNEIFSLFDDLLLLKRGGQTVFFGPLGERCSNLISYMQSFPEVKKLEPGQNPANWMLVTINNPDSPDFADRYDQSELNKNNFIELKKLKERVEGAEPIAFPSEYPSTTQTQIKELLLRFAVHYWRTPNYNFLRMFLIGALALLFGSVFFQLDANDEQGVHSKISFIYFTTAFCGVLNMAGVLNVVVASRAVYYRERASKTYTVMPFNLGMFVAEIPYLLITCFIFVAIMYYMVGFDNDADQLLFFYLIFLSYSSMMTFYGQFLAIIFPSVQIAQTVGSAIVTIWNLFCGFLISKDDIPNYWIWLYYLSPIHYALDAIVGSQFYCAGAGCPQITVTQPGTGKQTTEGQWFYIQNTLGFNYDTRWNDFFAILGFLAFFRLGGFLGLRYIKHITR